ncbi:MAG: DUF533 domain-containing protein [Labilithrix sp.]|nr:DUF533 domain-containing protein [Labilithrix sp.]MCW5809864.1 DUF533 domain-containing protein [Labilithrix sp.]
MKRLTIGADACLETLALLIAVAWADGRLDEHEKDGVRGAASVFNLSKELRARLDSLLEKPLPVEELLVEGLSARDKAFAYVAASWLSGVDDDVDAKEELLLAKAAALLGISDARRAELDRIARDLEPLRKDKKSWANEVVALFKAIPARLEGDTGENFDVLFE